MLQFSLFGFPVRIHWFFWLNMALIGGGLFANTQTDMLRVVVFVVVGFLSILIHELGHAFVMRHYGDRNVHIMLYAFGGLAFGSIGRSRMQQIVISFAGPFFQIMAALLLWRLSPLLPKTNLFFNYSIASFISISIFWALLNLLPIIPMDGGRISEAIFGPRRERAAIILSMVCAVAVGIFALTNGLIIAGLFFGMLAFNNFQRLNNRPETPWMSVR